MKTPCVVKDQSCGVDIGVGEPTDCVRFDCVPAGLVGHDSYGSACVRRGGIGVCAVALSARAR